MTLIEAGKPGNAQAAERHFGGKRMRFRLNVRGLKRTEKVKRKKAAENEF